MGVGWGENPISGRSQILLDASCHTHPPQCRESSRSNSIPAKRAASTSGAWGQGFSLASSGTCCCFLKFLHVESDFSEGGGEKHSAAQPFPLPQAPVAQGGLGNILPGGCCGWKIYEFTCCESACAATASDPPFGTCPRREARRQSPGPKGWESDRVNAAEDSSARIRTTPTGAPVRLRARKSCFAFSSFVLAQNIPSGRGG